MHNNAFYIRYILLAIIYIILSNLKCNSQKRFLLNANDLEGFTLESQNNSIWPYNEDSLINQNVIEQTWCKSDNSKYYITYCEFKDNIQTIKAVTYAANSNAWPYFFGTSTGEIVGDASFINTDGSGFYFYKWNVGIKIFTLDYRNPENQSNIANIANIILSKITENVSPDIIEKEMELIKHQLSETEYQLITSKCNDILLNSGYNELKIENSKWIINGDSIMLGLRKLWYKENSSVSIDIAEYSNINDAKISGEFLSNISNIPYCNLSDSISINQAIEKFYDMRSTNETIKCISIIGQYNNLSMLFYYFDESGIDILFFKSILNIEYSEGLSIQNYMNHFSDINPNPVTNILNIQLNSSTAKYCKIYNSAGQLIKTLEINEGSNTYNISDLKTGNYFILIQTHKGKITKMIIKK